MRQAAFLDFIGEPAGSTRRLQQGVYASRLFDYGGADRRVLVILLDMRFHKDPYGTENGDFLGEAQWAWLEQTLRESDARVNLLVSSLQLLEPRHGLAECWGRFPASRARLLRLLTRADLNVRAPVVLSGDVHFSELSLGRCGGAGGRALLEVTSSGMTHSWGTRPPSRGDWSVSTAMAALMRVAMAIMPWRYQLRGSNSSGGDDQQQAQHYLGLSFAELSFDWEAGQLAVSFVGTDGMAARRRVFSLAALDHGGGGDDGAAGESECEPVNGWAPAWQLPATVLLVALLLLSLAVRLLGAARDVLAMCCSNRNRKQKAS